MTTKIEENKKRMAEQIKARQEKKKGITFSVTQYQHMKADGLSDTKIMEKHGLNPVQLNKWKNEHNLIGKHNVKTIQKQQGEAAEVKSTTNQTEQQNVVQATTDTSKLEQRIEYLEKVNERQLADNQKLAAENTRLHKEMQEPVDTSLEEELHKWKSDHAEMTRKYQKAIEDCAKMDDHLSEVKTHQDKTNAELILLENQLENATERIEELKSYERDYQALEVVHANMRARTHSMEEEVEETRAAMKMLDSLYRGQSTLYLKSRDRLDELEVGV